tara:strand:- start:475 stop:810 length:336 start_codon:yes stop_codon:yes gene_type:complete
MAATPTVNIVIAQGTTFSEVFTSTESDGATSNLVGFTGASQIKKHETAKKSESFSVSINGGTGEVSIGMTSGATSRLSPGRYLYDIILTSPAGSISRLVGGQALVTAGITT